MICPICKERTLEAYELAEKLKAYKCFSCEGYWIRHEDYWKWHKSSNPIKERPGTEVRDANLPAFDCKQAKICPDCGRILIKYRVDNRLDFYLDHCGHCSGVWFDKNEWENLKINNLHNNIYSFFTKPWQKKLRDEAARDNLKDKYIKKFGRWEYERLKEIRDWIYKSECKNEMLAYLLDEDPYKI